MKTENNVQPEIKKEKIEYKKPLQIGYYSKVIARIEDERSKKEKTKKISIYEGSANAVSEGFGIRYITPYALALGATNAQIGMLSSCSTLLGYLSQLFTTKAMEKISRKKITFYGALFQAISWLVVLLLGVLFFSFDVGSNIVSVLLIIAYSLLVMFDAFYGPAWNSWMKDIVTEKSGNYFGMRNRITGAVSLIAMLVASFILDHFERTKIFYGFIILFSIAFAARSVSAVLFLRKYDPTMTYEQSYYFSFMEFIKKMPYNNFGKFVILVSLMQFATAIASPFFAIYMLKQLNFSYSEWIVVTIIGSLFSLIFMPLWGKFADSYGNLKAAKICAFLIPFVPLLYLVSVLIRNHSSVLIYLMVIEALSGTAWAGFNLSTSTFIYDAVTRQRMALCVAYSNVLTGIGVFIGAGIGSLISLSDKVLGISTILFIFILSFLARFSVALVMTPKIKEVRDVKNFGIKEAKQKLSVLTLNSLFGNSQQQQQSD